MGYKFIKTKDPTNKHDRSTIIYEIHDDDITLPELLEEIEQFLRAASFCFDGRLEVVDLADAKEAKR